MFGAHPEQFSGLTLRSKPPLFMSQPALRAAAAAAVMLSVMERLRYLVVSHMPSGHVEACQFRCAHNHASETESKRFTHLKLSIKVTAPPSETTDPFHPHSSRSTLCSMGCADAGIPLMAW